MTGVPAYRALAEAFPDHRMVLAAPAALAPLAALTGVIDEVLPTAGLQPLGCAVESPAVAVNLHGRGPQSHRIVLATRPGRLIAFANPRVPETSGLPRWAPDEHEVHRWCRLLEEEGIASDPARLDLRPPEVQVHPALIGATVVHPGAAAAARRWPVDRWAAVARDLRRLGRRVVITGSPEERELCCRLAGLAGLPEYSVLAGRTDLVQLAALVAGASTVLCGDTGVAHLATALGTPSVVLFGPTSPATWGPPPDRRQHRALWKGSVGDPLGAAADEGLLRIGVDEVLGALNGLAGRTG